MKSLLIVLILVFTATPCMFQVGDIVTLKSGGEGMTVVDVDDDCSIYVAYFSMGHSWCELSHRIYPEDALKFAPDKKTE